MTSLLRDVRAARWLLVAIIATLVVGSTPAETFAEMQIIHAPRAGSRLAQMKEATVSCIDKAAMAALILAARLDRAGGGDGGGPIMVAMARKLGCDKMLPAKGAVWVEQIDEADGRAIECIRPQEWAECRWALAGNRSSAGPDK